MIFTYILFVFCSITAMESNDSYNFLEAKPQFCDFTKASIDITNDFLVYDEGNYKDDFSYIVFCTKDRYALVIDSEKLERTLYVHFEKKDNILIFNGMNKAAILPEECEIIKNFISKEIKKCDFSFCSANVSLFDFYGINFLSQIGFGVEIYFPLNTKRIRCDAMYYTNMFFYGENAPNNLLYYFGDSLEKEPIKNDSIYEFLYGIKKLFYDCRKDLPVLANQFRNEEEYKNLIKNYLTPYPLTVETKMIEHTLIESKEIKNFNLYHFLSKSFQVPVRQLTTQNGNIIVCDQENKPFAYCNYRLIYSEKDPHCFVNLLFVAKDRRTQGIGKEIKLSLEKYLLNEKNINFVYFYTHKSKYSPLTALVQNEGFVDSGEKYPEDFDKVKMIKRIKE